VTKDLRRLNTSRRGVWLGALVVAAALQWAPPGAAATLTRGPYLQRVGETGALVVWRTAAAAACTLTASAVGQPTVTVVTPSATQHVATLAALAPGTRYDYSIRSAGNLAGGSDCFVQTAPPPHSGATVRFLFFGDSGTGTNTQAAVAAQLNAQTVQFGLHVGDVIYPGGEAHYYDPRYFTPYAPFLRHTPLWAAIGNHDEITPSSFLAAWYLPTNPVNGSERFYSFDYGDVHCVALDTTEPFTTAILNWLRSDLDATTRQWKIVYFHHTMYSCGDYHGSSSSLISTLAPIFEQHGVDLVLYGHDHHYERSFPMRNGQPVSTEQDPDYVLPGAPMYIISGTGGGTRSTSTDCEHTARAISTPGFVRFEVTGSDLAMEAVAADGNVIDRMSLSKANAPPPPPPVDLAHVVAPNGGEAATVGSTLDLRWTASASVTTVRVELSRTGANGPWETLFSATPNDGHEAWTVTGPPSATCWLRVCDSIDGAPSDLSDAAFALVSPPAPPPPGTAIVRVNFQPEGTPLAHGYSSDLGLVFDAGRGFGWNTTQVMVGRNALPGDPRDTFVDVINTSTAVWEVVVPNGAYRVSLTCGDLQTTATHRVALEGQRVIDDVHTPAGTFVQHADLPVNVLDGRLTLTVGGSGTLMHTKVNSIVVAPPTSETTPYVLESWSQGETRCIGLASTVAWSGSGAAAPLRLELSRSGPNGAWEAIALMMDDGDEAWAPSGAPSSDCWLRLVDASGSVLDVTDTPFALQAPGMQLLTPNGGETWTAGTEHTFAWTSTCFVGSVRIETSRSGAAGPWTTLIHATPNDGFEPWVVREEDIGWTHARISALPFLIPGDGSDGAFSVVTAPVAAAPSWAIDFTVPNGLPAAAMNADEGLAFDPQRGFGWDRAVLTKRRDMLPADCRDTFVQVVNDGSARWELAVPNGEYLVSLVCGDPFTSGTHRVALEDKIVVQDVYAVGGVFVYRDDVVVNVNDGRLTMTLGGSGAITSTKVGCLTVRAKAAPRPSRRTRTPEVAPVAKDAAEISFTQLELPAGPVRGGTDLQLALARGGRVRLLLHDVRGRRVAVLLDGELPAGRHALRWEATDDENVRLASGVYFLQLDAPDRRDSRKLVLIR
jgi:hypothetical protein